MDDALEAEEETRRRVSDSLSKIESALSIWDAARRKPKGLERQVSLLRRFHGSLSAWEKNSLKGRRDAPSAAARLRRFARICRELESAGLG